MDPRLKAFVRKHGWTTSIAYFQTQRQMECAKITDLHRIASLFGHSNNCEKYNDILTELLYSSDGFTLRRELSEKQ